MSEETIFEAALGKRNPAERSAYLDRACGIDLVLRRRVEALLASSEKSPAFLERPAIEQMRVTRAEQHEGGDETDLSFLQPTSKAGSLGRLAHYEVLEVLGQGGSGTVMRAFDEKLHRMVAIKILAPQLAATSPPRKRFLREARASAAIRHENVVGIHAVDDQPIPYLVMEYIAGETLQQRLDRTGPLEVADVLCIGQQIAAGLAAAHALGLVHRDIKPANILLENGALQRVKITDFGLARAADDASLTQSGLIAGTPMYMAPEQAQGEKIDARTDLFSLGSVLYVMCTGRPPFRASTTLAVLKRVAEDAPRPIREIIPEVPGWLCAIIAKLHAKSPADRFGSAQEVADLLARHLAKLRQDKGLASAPAPIPRAKVVARPRPAVALPIPAPRTPRWAPRTRRWATAGALLLFVLAGLGLGEATGITNMRGTIIRLFSSEGTLVVEVDDPGVSVSIDGEEIVISGAGVKEVRLKPGPYNVEARKDGKLLRQELVTISKNGRQVVRISKESRPLADRGKEEKPSKSKRPGTKADGTVNVGYIPAAASAAVVLHPRRVLQSSFAAMLPAGAIDQMVKDIGIRPDQVEDVIVFLQVGGSTDEAATPAPKDDWPELESKEGRFSARFPTKPKASERKTTLGTRQVFAAEADEGKTTFEISYVDFPKDSPFVGDRSRVDFATRALEFKPGFKDVKDIKLGNHLGAEVVLDDVQLKIYAVHRVYVVGDRLYNLEATTRTSQKPPKEFSHFFDAFTLAAEPALPDLAPLPGIIVRFAEPVNGKKLLTHLLKGLREEKHAGNTYYRSSTGEALFGLPMTGAVPDERTILVAPDPIMRKMLAAGSGAKSPLLDRLRQAQATDEVTGILVLEPYRPFLNAFAGPLKALLPPDLAELASQPDHVTAITAAVSLRDKALLKVTLEADSKESAATLDDLAFKALKWARPMYPGVRPALADAIPAELVQPVLAIADQLYSGVQVTKDGKRLVVVLERPEGLEKPPEKDLIASAGFNDARGMNSNPVPGSPYPLDTPNRPGGSGEPGWAGPWLAHPDAVFQKKVAFEGDGALYLKGAANVGPNYGRQLARPQTGKFQVECHIQVPAGSTCVAYIWQGRDGGALRAGPQWTAGGGKFSVGHGDVNGDISRWVETDFKCEPGRWYKVVLRIDVTKRKWEFFVDDRRVKVPEPLNFRAKVDYLDYINFLVAGGVYLDALRVTRLADDVEIGAVAPKRVVKVPPNHIASSGFNNAKGLHGDPKEGPFPVDVSNREGGHGEPGWAGPWPAHPKATFQSKVVYEGDGALYLMGSANFGPNYGRQLAKAQTGRFQVEHHVQVPAGSKFGAYVWQHPKGADFSGPNWSARDGRFDAYNQDTGFKCVPGQWYKLTLRIDVPSHTWDFAVDGKRFVPATPLKFRGKVAYLDYINFLVEGGVYIDDLRVTRLDDGK